MKDILAPLAAALLLAGCAAMDKNQCQNANWYAIGLEDGGQGRTLDRLGERRRACADHGVQPDGERYAAGRNEGLKSFCTYDRGYRVGYAGSAYYGVCPEPMARDFVAGYERGRELHGLQKRLGEVNAICRPRRRYASAIRRSRSLRSSGNRSCVLPSSLLPAASSSRASSSARLSSRPS